MRHRFREGDLVTLRPVVMPGDDIDGLTVLFSMYEDLHDKWMEIEEVSINHTYLLTNGYYYTEDMLEPHLDATVEVSVSDLDSLL